MTTRYLPLVLIPILIVSCASSPERKTTADGGQSTLKYTALMMDKAAGSALTIVRGRERDAHFEFTDRGRGPSLDAHVVVGEGEVPALIDVRGHDYLKAPIAERYDGATRSWKNK